uniref:Methylated-DNA--protein-cysteine methyltransferase n=1 Tax=Nothoprocta perdicaria TaxID=30464 RepID=A0A8C6ZQX5_NOTPE
MAVLIKQSSCLGTFQQCFGGGKAVAHLLVSPHRVKALWSGGGPERGLVSSCASRVAARTARGRSHRARAASQEPPHRDPAAEAEEARGAALPAPLEQCVAWLRAYFCEPARTRALPLPAFHHPLLLRASFTREVLWRLLGAVPFGEAVSYQRLAALAGSGKAARAVGSAVQSNPIPIIIPCHRVIRSSGDLGQYGGGALMKQWLLSHEKLAKMGTWEHPTFLQQTPCAEAASC